MTTTSIFLKKTLAVFSLIIFFIIICLPVSAKSDDDAENEYNTWISAAVKHDFSKKFRLKITPELRLTSDFEWNKFLIEGELEYELLKYLGISGGYRFTIDNNGSKDDTHLQRFFLDINTSTKINRFKPKFRLKYTNESRLDKDKQYNYLRYKGSIDYNIRDSKINPFVSIEAFHSLDDQMIDKLRYHIGAEYKINKHHQVEAGYMLDSFTDENKYSHIVGLKYDFKF